MSRLDDRPPGPYCPACWHPCIDPPAALTAHWCPRCYALLVCHVAGQLQRAMISDLGAVEPEHRTRLLAERWNGLQARAGQWRAVCCARRNLDASRRRAGNPGE